MRAQSKKICLFAGYSPDFRVHDYVVYYIENLSEIADVHYLADCEMAQTELDRLGSYTVSADGFRHGTYDFGSWKELIHRIGWEKINEYDELILCNDSCYGPVFGFGDVFEKMSLRNVDFWGLSSSPELSTLHLQSYFLVFTREVFRSAVFKSFFEGIRAHPDFWDVITNYEIALTRMLANEGFRFEAFFKGRSEINPTTFPLSILRDFRFPLIKIKAFTNPHTNLNERLEGIDSFVSSHSDYEPEMFRKHLDIVAPDYRERIEQRFADRSALAPPTRAEKMLVHLHLPNAEEAPYFVSKLLNVPGEFDLIVTMSESVTLVEDQLAIFGDRVKVLDPGTAANDMSAFFYVIREVGLEEYDYVLKMHSMGIRLTRDKLLDLDMWAYGWRNSLVDPLLESGPVFMRHLELLRADPEVGMLASAALTSSEFREPSLEGNEMVEKWKTVCALHTGDVQQPVVVGRMFLMRAKLLSPLLSSGGIDTILSDAGEGGAKTETLEYSFETFLSLLLLHGNSSVAPVGEGGFNRKFSDCEEIHPRRVEVAPATPDTEQSKIPAEVEDLELSKSQAGFLKKCLKVGKLFGVLDTPKYRKLKEALRASPNS